MMERLSWMRVKKKTSFPGQYGSVHATEQTVYEQSPPPDALTGQLVFSALTPLDTNIMFVIRIKEVS